LDILHRVEAEQKRLRDMLEQPKS
ncbi:MAG: hypothetical protein QOH26_1776, partial [Actinomycetota bacterium]|nr:hypothetical protein [Actinomycetota bacterium]